MNSIVIALGMIAFLALAYRFYGGFVERTLVARDDRRQTPAVTERDGVDYEPANPLILFGHHFSSIAGVAPIVGPILAISLFGWGPTLAWIAIGSVFIGAVHDYMALGISIRNRGRSIAEVAARVVSPTASRLFAIFLWLALILVIAVFASVGADALMSEDLGPKMVFPTFMIIVIAMIFGLCIRNQLMPLWLATLLFVGAALYCIYVGNSYIQLELPHTLTEHTRQAIWFGILMLYCLVASILPVWLLLQPRDYISVFKLFLGLLVGFLGLLIAAPVLNAPFWQGAVSAKGPLWPMLFVIVACGAVSGFHSVVASGTTSKQLAHEGHGKPVSYGAMIVEAALAVLSLCLVGGGLLWGAAATGTDLSAIDILGKQGGGPLAAFAKAFGEIVGNQAFAFIGPGLAGLFGMVMLKTFTLTTLDTSTRLARFVVTEQFAKISPIFHNRIIATVITIVPAFALLYSGAWNVIWPVFGAANQLIAALAMMVAVSYLLGCRRPTIYVLVPAGFMLLTTLGALVLQLRQSIMHVNEAGQPDPQWALLIVSVALIGLAVYFVSEVWQRTDGFTHCPTQQPEIPHEAGLQTTVSSD